MKKRDFKTGRGGTLARRQGVATREEEKDKVTNPAEANRENESSDLREGGYAVRTKNQKMT